MTDASGPEQGGEVSSEALVRSQEAIDEAREATRGALSDPLVDGVEATGAGGGAESTQDDVAPRPN